MQATPRNSSPTAFTTLVRSLALCGVAAFAAAGAQAAGDRTGYDQAKASAKTTYDSEKKACDSLKGNAEDVCEAEAKARRTKTETMAEADWKGTAKARYDAVEKTAKADYNVAKEKCDDLAGNGKDICVKDAKAAMTRTVADAKAKEKGGEARADAMKDKRDADYKAAAERCDSLSGDPKSACIASAKAKFGKT